MKIFMILTTVAEGDDHGVGTSFMKYEVNVASAKPSLRLPGDMDVHQFDFMVRVKNLLRVDDVSDPKLDAGMPERLSIFKMNTCPGVWWL